MARWTTDDIPDQAGRTILVTGANGGLGLRTAEALAFAGAAVLLACRNLEKAAAALDAVAAKATQAAPRLVALDLADLSSVRRCAAEVDSSVECLDGLVNNAGVMAVPRQRTADGFEMQFGTNHLGHFALTGLLLPALLRARAPRVVTVSSIAHWAGRIRWRDLNADRRYRRWPAYSQSKLANLLFASELHRRAGQAGAALVSVAAHPGVSDTNLYGPISGFGARVFGQPDTMGALPQLRALCDPSIDGNDYVGASRPLPGPLELRGAPRRVPRSPLARRADHANRLWTRSEELTGVVFDLTAARPKGADAGAA